ncbi:MAG: hypothetical protein KIH08_14970 [Candidatus Freyarchaeota archaeon]|nr:hypothetical protein [Candidatus Jordarchaeia archaeon]MBS7270572.1 hypothetical protein [Candidatus Jordarchaeia archaeon]
METNVPQKKGVRLQLERSYIRAPFGKRRHKWGDLNHTQRRQHRAPSKDVPQRLAPKTFYARIIEVKINIFGINYCFEGARRKVCIFDFYGICKNVPSKKHFRAQKMEKEA